MKSKKIALVLSGGGFNGAFQLGVLNYINKHWNRITGSTKPMHFNMIAGVSAGALNGALVAMNKLDLLNHLWLDKIGRNGVSEIYNSDVLDTSSGLSTVKLKLRIKELLQRLVPDFDIELNLFQKLSIIFSKKKRKTILKEIFKDLEKALKSNLSNFKSIADNSPLKRKLEKIVSKKEMKTKYYCGFVSLDDGHYHSVESNSFFSNSDLVNGILASTAIPVVWEPVKEIKFYHKEQLVISKNNIDGGIRNSSPLGDVMKQINLSDDDYKIIVINCNSGRVPNEDFDQKSIGAIAARSIYNISMTEIFNNDLDHIIKMNQAIKDLEKKVACTLYGSNGKVLKSHDIVVINPHPNIDLGNPLAATKSLIDLRMKHGESMAKTAFETYQR